MMFKGTPLDNNMHYCPNCGAKMDRKIKFRDKHPEEQGEHENGV